MDITIIDVGSSWSALHTRPIGLELDIPIMFIDPDVAALANLPVRPQDRRLNVVAANYDGFIPFYFYPGDGVHSALKVDHAVVESFIDGHTGRSGLLEEWQTTRIEQLPCFRLDTIITALGVSSVPFLKVDTQGFELQVLEGLTGALESIQFLQVEVRLTSSALYTDSPDSEQVSKWVTDRGFRLVSTHPHTWGQEADLIFENPNYHGQKTQVSLSMLQHSRAMRESDQDSGFTRSHPHRIRRWLERVSKRD